MMKVTTSWREKFYLTPYILCESERSLGNHGIPGSEDKNVRLLNLRASSGLLGGRYF